VNPIRRQLVAYIEGYRPRRIRDLWAFAEAEIRLPDGKYKGLKFSAETQPYVVLWFQAHAQATERIALAEPGRVPEGFADCRGLRIFIVVGPTQSGKTLSTMVIPAMWHLFEHEETVCCLVPDESMANDKWKKDFLPAIRASRYAGLLPTRGEGSRDGDVTDSVTFQNGATLKFLTGGGSDKSVAGYTSRVLVATEINAFGKMSEASSEGNRWEQALGRLRSYGEDAVVYGECTVDTEQGLVWTEYSNGTASRIAMPCGYCGDYVTLGRENLVGWQQAKTIVQASEFARWCCPACGTIWEPGDRELFARGSVLLHRGQEIVKVACG
jgi:phage terminase large subunit GpA-like protein